MKKNFRIIAAFIFAAFFITSCNQKNAADLLKDDAKKKEIVSAILTDDKLSSEIADSLMINQHDKMMGKMDSLMKHNKIMQSGMMSMMMNNADNDTSTCTMMVNEINNHPDLKKKMEDCSGMKGMKDAKDCDMGKATGNKKGNDMNSIMDKK